MWAIIISQEAPQPRTLGPHHHLPRISSPRPYPGCTRSTNEPTDGYHVTVNGISGGLRRTR